MMDSADSFRLFRGSSTSRRLSRRMAEVDKKRTKRLLLDLNLLTTVYLASKISMAPITKLQEFQ